MIREREKERERRASQKTGRGEEGMREGSVGACEDEIYFIAHPFCF